MESDGALLLQGHDLCFLLKTAYYAVHGIEEVLSSYRLLVAAGGNEGCLVAHVGDVGTREARRLLGQEVDVDGVVGLHRTQVNLENLLALWQVWQVNVYLAVKSSGTQQSLVEHVGTVGSCKNDHAAVGSEAVHLDEQGVERVLALVVAAHRRVLCAGTAHGVDLVDEYYTWSLLLGLAEEIAHAACSHAHEHLDEVATAHREERHASLACHGLGQQGLARSRRSYEQHALRNFSSQFGIFFRLFQELHDLFNLLFCSCLSCHILEGHAHVVGFLIHLGFALAHVEHAAATAASPAAHEQHPEEHHKDDGSKVEEDVGQEVVLVVVVAHVNNLALLLHDVKILSELIDRAIVDADIRFRSNLLRCLLEHIAYVFRLDKHLQLVVGLDHHHTFGVTFSHIFLKLGVCCRLTCGAVAS